MVKICFLILSILIIHQFDCAPVEMLSYTNEVTKDSYFFSYVLSDGQQREETGTLKRIGESDVYVVNGFYSYKTSDGKDYRVEYTADENGYKAEEAGLTIPSASEVQPAEIQLPMTSTADDVIQADIVNDIPLNIDPALEKTSSTELDFDLDSDNIAIDKVDENIEFVQSEQ